MMLNENTQTEIADAFQVTQPSISMMVKLRHPVIWHFLYKRGCRTASELKSVLFCDRERIVVYRDYDCGGISAGAIAMECLSGLGAVVDHYANIRGIDGYGLCPAGVDNTLARWPSLFSAMLDKLGEANLNAHFGVAFLLAPMVNSASRLDADTGFVADTMISHDMPWIREQVNTPYEMNSRRKDITTREMSLVKASLPVQASDTDTAIIVRDDSLTEGLIAETRAQDCLPEQHRPIRPASAANPP